MNDDEKDDDKRQSRKRKKKDKERRKNEKQRRLDSPKFDENEPLRGASPEKGGGDQQFQQHSPHSSHENDESNESEYSSDNGREKKHYQRGPKSKNRDRHERKYNNRERSRERRVETQLKDSASVCLFYLQGKCNKVRHTNISFHLDPPQCSLRLLTSL